jgi:GNAT superfamily N-acetyltransferase
MSPAARTLPDSKSPNLHLTHPTEEEKVETWTLNSASWGGALSQQDYLEREEYLTKAPLARDGGVTHWILVDKELPPNRRPILASCETLRKRSLVSRDGTLTDVVSHGIGSVFCDPEYRGKGYASRMMKELGQKLRTWQAGMKGKICGFSALWSDIGKLYYAGHGWHPFPSTHIEFPPVSLSSGSGTMTAKLLESKDLQKLCDLDEAMICQTLARARDGKTHVCIVPDHEHIQWHHVREDFMCGKMFGKQPTVRGAIIGEEGHRIWAMWTRNFYGPVGKASSGNTLHILRLVIEDEASESSFSSNTGGVLSNSNSLDEQAQKLKAVLQVAQTQAAEWSLRHVELWNPTPLAQSLIQRTDLQHSRIERESESIPMLMWYGEGDGKLDDLEWVGNEKYGWC